MKKVIFSLSVLGLAILVLGSANLAYAHGRNPGDPDDTYPHGPGMMDGYGMMGGFGYDMHVLSGTEGMDWYGEEGPMHDAMINAAAELLGLSPEKLESRHDAGETLWEIAEAEGLSEEGIQELMFAAHDQALQAGIADGLLTQEQAEWMDEHMDYMWNGEFDHCGNGKNGDFGPGMGWHGMNW